jgi:hypothetical protein
MTEKRYVIWSEEHGGWWAGGSWGYTRSLRQAHRYSQEQAAAIIKNANAYIKPPDFNEIAIADPVVDADTKR